MARELTIYTFRRKPSAALEFYTFVTMGKNNFKIYGITLSVLIICSLLLCPGKVAAQNGTYEKKNGDGSYCYISLHKTGAHIKAEIFAWWNTPSAQTGSYYGEGTLRSNSCLLQSDENDPACRVSLTLSDKTVKASFGSCMTDRLPEEFNGIYNKITDAIAGDYTVSPAKSYFYKRPLAGSRLKSYLLRGDRVTLNLDRLTAGKWVYVYYTSPTGKETSGYIPLADLKKAE